MNGGYFAIGFVIGSAIVKTIFAIIEMFWNLFLSVMAILWMGFSRICVRLFNLSKRIGKKLYSSYKNRKTKS